MESACGRRPTGEALHGSCIGCWGWMVLRVELPPPAPHTGRRRALDFANHSPNRLGCRHGRWSCLSLHAKPHHRCCSLPATCRLLREASSWLQAADRTVTQMVDDRQPWQLIVLLAAFAIHLGRLCDSLWTQAQLSDSKVVYALCAGQLALLTGSALRVQQQLESRGSECQLHILSSMPLPHRDRQRMWQALRGNTAALRAAFGCGLLQRSSELLRMVTLPLHAAATAALVRTAAKPAVLLPWLAELLPSVQQLCQIDATNAGGELRAPHLINGLSCFQSHPFPTDPGGSCALLPRSCTWPIPRMAGVLHAVPAGLLCGMAGTGGHACPWPTTRTRPTTRTAAAACG